MEAHKTQESESEDPGESDVSEMVCSHSRIVHLLHTTSSVYELDSLDPKDKDPPLKDRPPKILTQHFRWT